MSKRRKGNFDKAQERTGVSPPVQRGVPAKYRRANATPLLRSRIAFTLVELLVVGAIIVIIMVLTLFVMSSVTKSTKETKTRATIQKLDVAIQQIFETYDEKAATIRSRVARDYREETSPNNAAETVEKRELRETIVAHFIRDTMRMEMPQSWAEVYNSAGTPDADGVYPKLGPVRITLDGNTYEVEEPPVLNFYWEVYAEVQRATGKPPGRAALLFLIIQNLNPEALEAFHGSEVADTDGDGLLEFVDAWGKPIQFLRWAPAFPGGGGLQQDVLSLAGYVPKINADDNATWWQNSYRTGNPQELRLAIQEARNSPVGAADPFDGRRNAIGWFLYPLIYSAGPDGKYDIVSERVDTNGNPISPTVRPGRILDPFAFPYGMPGDFDGNGVLNHFDNIHNHQWYRTH